MPSRVVTPPTPLWVPVLKGFLIGLLLLAVFLGGFFFRDVLPAAVPGLALADSTGQCALLTDVYRLLEQHYLRELPDSTTLEYAAIRGMMGALEDPYTFFVDPPVARSESDVLAGQYGGIGVQVQHAEDGSFVLYPFPNSSAAEAGVQDGDILVAIGDWVVESTARIDVIDQAMRGEVGNNNGVSLRVRRTGVDEELKFEHIPFAVIEVLSVIWRVLAQDPRLGYLQILRFTSRTPEELRTALEELQGAGLSGLVLDVRNNAGGLLQEAIQAADQLLDEGVIVYEATRSDEQEFTASSDGIGVDLPMAILVNRGTASAAELVAGALRDNDLGILIGQNTYGKGSVQMIFPLVDGSSVHITAAEWFTPNRTPLDQHGLTPDISMIPAEDGRDVELGEAIRYLQQQISSS